MPFPEILYIAIFVLTLGAASLVLWGRRRDRIIYEIETESAGSTGMRMLPVAEKTSPGLSRATPTDLKSVDLEEIPTQAPIAQLLFASASQGDHRECPKCDRKFGETVVLCPFDATPLRALHARSRRTTKPAVTGSKRPSCSSCGRRYEGSAKYCYHDGTRLSSSSPAEVPVIRACRNCGHETADPAVECECAVPDVVEVDASRSSVQMPTIPLVQCRRCNYLAPGGVTTCPNDGDLLYPMMNVQMNALPPTGIGPKRRVCEQCGRKFSTTAHYCAYDGSKLQDLN